MDPTNETCKITSSLKQDLLSWADGWCFFKPYEREMAQEELEELLDKYKVEVV